MRASDTFKIGKAELLAWIHCCACVPHGPAESRLDSFIAGVHGEHDRVGRELPAEAWVDGLDRQPTMPVERGALFEIHATFSLRGFFLSGLGASPVSMRHAASATRNASSTLRSTRVTS